jgi:hypothetical protein
LTLHVFLGVLERSANPSSVRPSPDVAESLELSLGVSAVEGAVAAHFIHYYGVYRDERVASRPLIARRYYQDVDAARNQHRFGCLDQHPRDSARVDAPVRPERATPGHLRTDSSARLHRPSRHVVPVFVK